MKMGETFDKRCNNAIKTSESFKMYQFHINEAYINQW